MTTKTSALLPNHPFWGFSRQLNEPAKEHLLKLQNQYHLNTNVVLFCLWFAANNHGLLTKQELKHLLTRIHIWHERIVNPLRNLCDSLKKVSQTHVWTESVQDEMSATELAAEQIEELLIIDAAPRKAQRSRSRTLAQRAASACQNIVTYCQVLYIHLDERDCASLAAIIATVFPELSTHDIMNLCHSALTGKAQPNHLGHTQLQLELLMQ